MRLTTKVVTDAIRLAGLNGELVRGNGYYYFSGPSFEICKIRPLMPTAVITRSIAVYSVEEWVAKAKELGSESKLACRDAAIAAETPEERELLGSSIADAPSINSNLLLDDGAPITEEDLLFATDSGPVFREHRLKFYEIEHGGDLQEALDALTSIGCVIGDINAFDVSFDHEYAVIPFTTTMSLKDVRALLAHTNVVL